jgi:hypothetical protein
MEAIRPWIGWRKAMNKVRGEETGGGRNLGDGGKISWWSDKCLPETAPTALTAAARSRKRENRKLKVN